MVQRIPSTLMRSVDPASGDIVYVDRPSFFQELTFDWQYAGFFERIALAVKAIVCTPFLFFGVLISLLVCGMDMDFD